MRKGYCLGIESTADDFGVGIASFKGEVLANVNSAYTPEEGGIHPREAARHHARVAGKVLAEAIEKSGIETRDLKVIAFSQGPGLGPCLRTGATAARALASYLSIPLVGVNHCVAHIEIGKLISKARNPVTLYVSGGNTIVSAFEASGYRVFGETLDIAVGNCLDVFAREAGLRPEEGKPLGRMVEELAAQGKKFIPLPYTVKGMDLSFSGLLTAAVNLLREKMHRLEDVCFSFQEAAFSMLTEVTERALAHTEKPEVLLTGGVAANERLRSMLEVMAEEHNARFCVAPKEFSMDNGAMIAWTGVLCYRHDVTVPVEESFVKLKWRLDEVEVPWVGNADDDELMLTKKDHLIKKGAEASLYLEEWHNRKVILKKRLPKRYRVPELDREIQVQRTKHEPQIIHKAKEASVPTPVIFSVDLAESTIIMEFVEGKQVKQVLNDLPPEERAELCRHIGELIGRLHSSGIIHGDLTTSNMILTPQGKVVFIDFGLSEQTRELEARGVDLHLMKRALTSTHYRYADECFDAVMDGYEKVMGEIAAREVIHKTKEIEKRGRYISER